MSEVNKTNEVNLLDEVSNFIFTSKYARYNERLQRRETWDEAVDRLEEMHLKKYRKLAAKDRREIEWAFSLVRKKRVVPSMRSLQFGGKAIESKNLRMFNCSVRHVDSPRAFSEIFFALLCGTGVGIGLSYHFLNRLPNLVEANDKTGTVITYVIQDDIEGWSDSVEALLLCYFKNTAYTGRKIVFDYSKIRKKGAPLKTGGGKAPGYKGLKNAHQKIKEMLDYIIEGRQQRRLRSVDAYDILMHCADAVLSGGVRRSACSVVFDKNDEDMLSSKTYFKIDKKHRFGFNEDTEMHCGDVVVGGKKYSVEMHDKRDKYDYEKLQKEGLISWRFIEPQRARSNNSVLLLRSQITLEEFKKIVERTKEFGEPGFVFANDEKTLFNPCQPAFAPILTPEGLRTMGDIKIGDLIWSESGWTKVINKWSTGTKKVYAYRTTAGVFYGTENHRIVSHGEKVEVGAAESIDLLSGPVISNQDHNPQMVLDGLVQGDGTRHLDSADKIGLLIGEDDQDYFQSEVAHLIGRSHSMNNKFAWKVTTTFDPSEVVVLPERNIPDRFMHGTPNKVASFLRGLYSANGSICGDRVTLKTSNFRIVEQVQIMLSSLGIKSYFTTNKPKTISWTNGDYESKESYDLNITTDRVKFKQTIGFIQKYKMETLEEVISKAKRNGSSKKTHDIISNEFLGEMEVFDITVDNQQHTYWTGGLNVSNCFEISFIPVEDGICGMQMCNLTSINGGSIKTFEDFLECVKAATIIGTLQAGYTEFDYLNNTSKKLTEDESLLGVSITGMMDSPDILLNPAYQKQAAQYAIEINKDFAKKIGINQAARITCIKPEGTSSLVLGCGSGIHPHHASHYLRRVQCNKLDNVYRFFKKHNPQLCEESVWSANKTDDVVSFPVEVSEGTMLKSDLTALKHLAIIKSTQQNWVQTGRTEANKKNIHHNVSCTVICKDDEWDDVIKYLFENREYFAAVSLLSAFGDKDYQQAPMEKMETEEELKKFQEMQASFKHVDYTKMVEEDDETAPMGESACAGGSCEIIRL